MVRQGMRQVLSAQPDFQVVAEAANHAEVMQQLRRQPCDVLVIDIAMPGKNGIETLKQVHVEFPKLPTLVLSMYPADQYGVRALRAGASGYITKMAATDQLVEAIRQVASGRKYITEELAHSLAETIHRDTDTPPHLLLSDREFQTLRMMASGKTLSQIGQALSLSPKTVSVYRARLLEKLGMHSNAELTRYALENKLVE